MKLFSVFFGGRAKKCNTELHDVVFTCGETIKDAYYDLLDKWFGLPDRSHIDSWVEISIIDDGYKVTLKKENSQSLNKLYFINFGAYDFNKFEELHESKFMVGMEENTIKNRAKKKSTSWYVSSSYRRSL